MMIDLNLRSLQTKRSLHLLRQLSPFNKLGGGMNVMTSLVLK
ncbi:MAG: hypothetical protein AAGE84_05115 [Cyanobacteria bacterium P01_G01_bin.39]